MTGPLDFFQWVPVIPECVTLGNRCQRLRGLALEVGGLVWVDEVALGCLVHGGGEFGAGLSGAFLVAGSDGCERLFAQGFNAAFGGTIAVGADDGLAGAFDG